MVNANVIVDTTGALYAAGQRVHKPSARLQRRNAATKVRRPCGVRPVLSWPGRGRLSGRPFCFALVNRGRDAAWAKSYGSIS